MSHAKEVLTEPVVQVLHTQLCWMVNKYIKPDSPASGIATDWANPRHLRLSLKKLREVTRCQNWGTLFYHLRCCWLDRCLCWMCGCRRLYWRCGCSLSTAYKK